MNPDPQILLIYQNQDLHDTVHSIFRRANLKANSFLDPEVALKTLKETKYPIIISEQKLAKISGLDFLRQAKSICPESLGILIMDSPEIDTVAAAVNERLVKKVISPPLNHDHFLPIIQDCLEIIRNRQTPKLSAKEKKEEELKLKQWDDLLRNSIRSRTRLILQKKSALENNNRMLQANIYETIKALFLYLEKKNHWIGSHSKSVTAFSIELAHELKLSERQAQTVEIAALVHDIGKLGISDKIISKRPHLLSKPQLDELRQHPIIGQKIIAPIFALNDVGTIIRHHHEHWDGKGYPNELKGEAIPLGARIIAVSDAFVNLIDKVYHRTKNSAERALKDLTSQKNTVLQPDLVEAFIKIIEDKQNQPVKAKFEKRLELNDLQVGMMIARDIVSTRGTTVLRKGQVLTEHHLKYLMDFNRLEKIFEEVFVVLEEENRNKKT